MVEPSKDIYVIVPLGILSVIIVLAMQTVPFVLWFALKRPYERTQTGWYCHLLYRTF